MAGRETQADPSGPPLIPSLLRRERGSNRGDSLIVQWLRLHLPMQGVWVLSLVEELRSTRHGGPKKSKGKTEAIL